MNPNIQSVTLSRRAKASPAVADALERLDRDVTRFFDFNGPRPVWVRVTWKGRYWVARATYPSVCGGTMTLACTTT